MTEATNSGQAAGPALAADHQGMRIDYSGLLGQCARELRPRYAAHSFMLEELRRHLGELGERFYAGDVAAVDEFLQLYCVGHELRAAIKASQQ